MQTYFYGRPKATRWQVRNTRENISQKEKPIYEAVFNHLYKILMKAKNKYIQSFL